MEALKKEVLIPIKISKRKTGSPTYFMKNQYVKTQLSKLLAKAYIMDKRLKENPKMQSSERFLRFGDFLAILSPHFCLDYVVTKIKKTL